MSELNPDDRLGLPSASGAERLHNCPGSWLLERTCPPLPSTADADSGIRIHAALAGFDVKLSDEEEKTRQECERLCAELVEVWYPFSAGRSLLSEKRIALRDAQLSPLLTGRFDRLYFSAGDNGLLIDWKTGHTGAEVAASNLQLRALAVMAANEYGLNAVRVAIIQPNAAPQVSVADYDCDDLSTAERLLSAALAAAQSPLSPRKPGAWCQYCRAKAVCPEFREQGLAVAKFSCGLPDMPGDQLATLLDQCKLAEQVVDAARSEAKRRLTENPEAIPGWRLKPGRHTETVTKPQDVFARAYARGVRQEDFLSCVTVGKAKLEAAVKAATGFKGMALESTMDVILDGCTETKVSAPILERVK